MSEKIVVGYNGSDSATEAVMWAANEATVRHVPLRVVSCFELPVGVADASLGWGVGTSYKAIRDAAAADVDEISSAVKADHPTLTFTADMAPGPAATALLEGVTPGDLVVVGSSSHHGLSAFWLGTTSRQLVHNSPCPVAVIRGDASRGSPDRIVVGVDGSRASDLAVEWAADEADRHRVDLLVAHGWSYQYSVAGSSSTQARELTEIDAAVTLGRAVDSARERCGSTVTGALVETSAVSTLLDIVHDGDLLVLGSRGRGGIRTRLFGSTVNSVLDECAVPVVVVRDDGTDGNPDPNTSRATSSSA